MRPRLVCFDIDNTLCYETCFTEQDCHEARPNLDAVALCNKFYETDFLVIYTGRGIHLATATLAWLQRHNIRYHAIKFQKTPFDVYIDNDARTVDEEKDNSLRVPRSDSQVLQPQLQLWG